jgi:hypothetical protein
MLTKAEAIPIRGHAQSHEWSTDGKWLLIHSQTTRSRKDIEVMLQKPEAFPHFIAEDVRSIWDPMTGKVHELAALTGFENIGFQWDPFGRCLLGWTDDQKGGFYRRWDTGTWKSSIVMKGKPNDYNTWAAGRAAIVSPTSSTVRVYDSETKKVVEFRIPEESNVDSRVMRDPETVLVVKDASAETGTLFNLRTRSSREVAITPDLFKPPTATSGLDAGRTRDAIVLRDEQVARDSFREKKKIPHLVAVGQGDALWSDGMNPNATCFVWTSQGALLKRDIIKIPIWLSQQAHQSEASNIASLVAHSLLAAVKEADGTFPTQSNWRTAASKYLEDLAMLTRFTYTYSGGLLKDIENLYDTEIGYVSGDGGRAVAYASGRVQWIPDKK